MRVFTMVVLVSAAGCLSAPEFQGFVATSFPDEAPVTLDIRAAEIVYVNNDEFLDLVLTNATHDLNNPLPPADWGFFVFLGPQTDSRDLHFHAFVHTSIAPQALVVRDLNGDDYADVLVFGRNAAETGGQIQYFENTGGLAATPRVMFASTPTLSVDTTVIPSPGYVPAHLVVADLRNVGFDLVYANYANPGQVSVLQLAGDIGQLASGAQYPLSLVEPVFLNRLYAVPSQTPPASENYLQDILLVNLASIWWLFNDGTGDLAGSAVAATGFQSTSVALADLDGVPPIDVVGGSGRVVGGYTIAGATAPVPVLWDPGIPNPLDADLATLVAGDLRDGGPEVVLFKRGGGHVVLENVGVNGGGIVPSIVSTPPGGNVDLRTAVVGDFNHSANDEVWAFTFAGEVRCFQWLPPNLTECLL